MLDYVKRTDLLIGVLYVCLNDNGYIPSVNSDIKTGQYRIRLHKYDTTMDITLAEVDAIGGGKVDVTLYITRKFNSKTYVDVLKALNSTDAECPISVHIRPVDRCCQENYICDVEYSPIPLAVLDGYPNPSAVKAAAEMITNRVDKLMSFYAK